MGRHQGYKREEVLDKCMTLFWERGYDNTSAEEVVKCSGLSRSSIYHSFGDMHGLFLESLKHYIRSESGKLLSGLGSISPCPEGIEQLLREVLEDSLTPKTPRGCMVVKTATAMAQRDKQVNTLIRKNIQEVIKAFSVFIADGQHGGLINSQLSPSSLANHLFHAVTAIRLTTQVISDREFHYTYIRSVKDLFIKTEKHGKKRTKRL